MLAKSPPALMVLVRLVRKTPLTEEPAEVVPITSTVSVQVPPAPTVPPMAVRVVSVALGEKVGATPPPVQTAEALGAGATSRPDGRTSRSAKAGLSAAPFSGRLTVGLAALLITMLSAVAWSLRTIRLEAKLLEMVGRLRLLTVTLCWAWLPLETAAPSLPVTAPAPMVFSCELLRTIEVTSTSMSQRPLVPPWAWGTTPPDSEMVLEPGLAVTVPCDATDAPEPSVQV